MSGPQEWAFGNGPAYSINSEIVALQTANNSTTADILDNTVIRICELLRDNVVSDQVNTTKETNNSKKIRCLIKYYRGLTPIIQTAYGVKSMGLVATRKMEELKRVNRLNYPDNNVCYNVSSSFLDSQAYGGNKKNRLHKRSKKKRKIKRARKTRR